MKACLPEGTGGTHVGSVATITENGDLAPEMLPLPCRHWERSSTGPVHWAGHSRRLAAGSQQLLGRTGAADVKKHKIHRRNPVRRNISTQCHVALVGSRHKLGMCF